MTSTMLYSIIGAMWSIIVILLGVFIKSIIKSLESLTVSIKSLEENNTKEHNQLDKIIIKVEKEYIKSDADIEKRVAIVEGLQKSPLCPVVTKQLTN